MPNFQYKTYTTRRFRADLHERLKLFAAVMSITIEEAFNTAMERGLGELEKETQLTATIPPGAKYGRR